MIPQKKKHKRYRKYGQTNGQMSRDSRQTRNIYRKVSLGKKDVHEKFSIGFNKIPKEKGSDQTKIFSLKYHTFARKNSLFSEFINNCILDVEIVLSKMINEFDFYQSLDNFNLDG